MGAVDQALVHHFRVLLDVAGVLPVAEDDVLRAHGTHVADRQRHHPNRLAIGAAPDVDALEVPFVGNDAQKAIFHRRAHVRVDALGVGAAAAVRRRLDAPRPGLAAKAVAVFVAAAAHFRAAGRLAQHVPALRIEPALDDFAVQQVQRRGGDDELEAVAVERRRRIEQAGVANLDAVRHAEGLQLFRVLGRIAVGHARAAVPVVREIRAGENRCWLFGHGRILSSQRRAPARSCLVAAPSSPLSTLSPRPTRTPAPLVGSAAPGAVANAPATGCRRDWRP